MRVGQPLGGVEHGAAEHATAGECLHRFVFCVVGRARWRLGGPPSSFTILAKTRACSGSRFLWTPPRVERTSRYKAPSCGYVRSRPWRTTRRSSGADPQHNSPRKQMRGNGGAVPFEVLDDLAAAARVVDGCRIPYIAGSLGGWRA